MSEAGVGGELPQTRKHTVTLGDLGQGRGGKGTTRETGAKMPPFSEPVFGQGHTEGQEVIMPQCVTLDMLLPLPEPQFP